MRRETIGRIIKKKQQVNQDFSVRFTYIVLYCKQQGGNAVPTVSIERKIS